jgi:hypothetical protein
MAAALLGATGCSWTGRTFTSPTVVAVTISANSPLCSTSRVAVNLEDQKTFAQVKDLVGRLELRSVTLSPSVADSASPDAKATAVHGTVGVAESQQATATPLLTFDTLAFGEQLLAQLPGSTDETIEHPLDAAAASAGSALALKTKGHFFIDLNACPDQTPADFTVSTELGFYLEP